MADLLEARAEAVAEHLDVVALRARRAREGLVGHQHGRGEVVAQHGLHAGFVLVPRQVRPAQALDDFAFQVDQGIEMGQLEHAVDVVQRI